MLVRPMAPSRPAWWRSARRPAIGAMRPAPAARRSAGCRCRWRLRPSTVWKKNGRLTKARPCAVKVQLAAEIDSEKIGRLKTSIGIIGSASRVWRHTNSVPSTTARTSSADDHQPLMAVRHAVDAEDQQAEGDARQDRRQHVERPVDMRGVRQVALGQQEGDDAERHVDGEQDRPRGDRQQRRADRGAGGQRGRDHGGVEAEPAAQHRCADRSRAPAPAGPPSGPRRPAPGRCAPRSARAARARSAQPSEASENSTSPKR